MSDVLVWIQGMFPDSRPLWPTQVSAVINLHRSKLPSIPNEGRKRSVGGARKEGRKKERGHRSSEEEVTLARNSGGGDRRTEPRIDEDSDGKRQWRKNGMNERG